MEKKEKTILNVSVSITDTDVFEHVLAILGVIYRNTKDEDLKKYIEEELDRALKGEWDIEGVLNPRIAMYRCRDCIVKSARKHERETGIGG